MTSFLEGSEWTWPILTTILVFLAAYLIRAKPARRRNRRTKDPTREAHNLFLEGSLVDKPEYLSLTDGETAYFLAEEDNEKEA